MKNKQCRIEWLNKNPKAKEWIAKKYLSGSPTEAQISRFVSMQHEDKYNKIKQCWRTYSHRKNRESISCELTVETYEILKKIQNKRTMTETLEEIIKTNYDARSHYKSIFERMTTELKQSKEKIIAGEINRLRRILETNSSDHKEVGKLKKITEEQNIQIKTLRSIVSTISEELINNGVTIKKDTLELIHKSLDTLLEKAEQIQTASHD